LAKFQLDRGVPRPGASGSGETAATATPAPSKTFTTTCKCCGKTGHVKKDCWHKDEACSVCGKKGHLKKVCRWVEGNTAAPATPAPAEDHGLRPKAEPAQRTPAERQLRTPPKATAPAEGRAGAENPGGTPATDSAEVRKCEACVAEVKEDAKVFCLNCNAYLCGPCDKENHTTPLLKKHKRATLYSKPAATPRSQAEPRSLASGAAVEVRGLADMSRGGGPTYEELVGGLREFMAQFGEVLSCRIERFGLDEPVVHFRTQEAADAALRALNAREIQFNGQTLPGGRQLEEREMMTWFQ